MSDKAVLVRESWARRVTSAIQTQEAAALNASAAGKPTFAESRFYDIRPARLQSNWTQNSAGVYQATAAFIVSDAGAVDTSFIFPVYNIPGAPAPTGTAGETRFFVIWRGRWEAVPMPEAGATAVVQLASNWTLTNGVWTATGNPVSAAGVVDSSTAVAVFAPQFTTRPPGIVNTYRFQVALRNNQWESLQNVETLGYTPVLLASAWALTNGVWTATGNPVSAAGVVDSSTSVAVFAPQFTTRPPGIVNTYRFQVAWRNNQWESLQNVETLGYTPVLLASAWALTNGVWTATGREIYADGTTSADASTIYAPQFTSQQTPPGTAGTARFWVMWRNNRWESVQDTIEGEVGDTLCPMILNQTWSRPTENDIYRADCYPLNANGATDTSGGTVTVFAPAAIGKPYGENLAWKFWAVYRNDRWETIQPNFPPQEGGGGGGEVDITITRPNTSTVQLAFEIV